MSFIGIRIERIASKVRSERARDGFGTNAHVAQPVERVLGKDEVISSILIMGSSPNENAADAQDNI